MPADGGESLECYADVYTPIPPTVYDNCGVLLSPTGPVRGETGTHCHGTVTFTWTYTDCALNSHDWVFTFQVDDYEPPIILGVPDNQIVECDGSFEFVDPTVSDNCDDNVVLYYSRDDGRPFHDPYFEPGTVTTFTFWATDACGNYTEESFTVTAELCDYWCTYTQGFYGNPGGSTCWGTSTPDLLALLLATDLKIGCPTGTPDFTIGAGDVDCVLELLPGGGTSKALEPGHGTCADPNFPQYKDGRAKNALVAQTIALMLNVREGGHGWGLGNLPIYNGHLMSAPMINCDPNIPPDPDSWSSRYMSGNVVCYLKENYNVNPTVYDLIALANDALCGTVTGNSFLGEITDAVTMINEGFDECRFGYFVEEPDNCGYSTQPGGNTPNNITSVMNNTILKAYPNPFSEVANVEFTVPMDVRVTLEVYTLQGQLVETLYTGMAEKDVVHTYQFYAKDKHMQSGYVYVLRTVYGTKTGKLVMIK